jgi:hypothetical protein
VVRILILVGAAAFAAVFVGEMLIGRYVLEGAAAIILVGTLLVLAEIMTAQVVLSQIGNVLIFVGSATMAWLLLYRPPSTSR